MNSRRSIYWLRGYGALARTDYKGGAAARGLRADPARSQLGRRDPPAVHLGNREHGGNGKNLRQPRFALAGCGRTAESDDPPYSWEGGRSNSSDQTVRMRGLGALAHVSRYEADTCWNKS